MKKIILDPGHVDGYNKGAVKPYAEGTAMFNYAHMLRDAILTGYKGADVILTRKTVKDDPTLAERGKMAAGADLFLSLHSNAATPTGYGVSVFYSLKRPGDKGMAQKWCDTLAHLIAGGTRARGAMTREGSNGDYYGVIRNSIAVNVAHSLIVEHGFHSAPEECRWLLEDANLQEMARTEAALVAEWLGLERINADAEGSTEVAPKPGWKASQEIVWRFYEADGSLARARWLRYGGKWYYLNADGKMATDWVRVSGAWYYLDPENGDMQTGWLDLPDGRYYLDPVNGDMKTGWQTIDGKVYQFEPSGRLVP